VNSIAYLESKITLNAKTSSRSLTAAECSVAGWVWVWVWGWGLGQARRVTYTVTDGALAGVPW
jgi:hypothetical protein